MSDIIQQAADFIEKHCGRSWRWEAGELARAMSDAGLLADPSLTPEYRAVERESKLLRRLRSAYIDAHAVLHNLRSGVDSRTACDRFDAIRDALCAALADTTGDET